LEIPVIDTDGQTTSSPSAVAIDASDVVAGQLSKLW
jgi:hypothetical protein